MASSERDVIARRFSSDDQSNFALLAGDANPLHLDPLYARRTQYGRPLVHGMHLLLWALDEYCARGQPGSLRHLKCMLRKAVGVDEEVRWSVRSGRQDKIQIDLHCRDELCMTLVCTTGPAAASKFHLLDADPPLQRSIDCEPETFETQEGMLGLTVSTGRLVEMFPNAARQIPIYQLAVLLSTTRLVGTYCPGLHSLYTSLQLEFSDFEALSEDAALRWHVRDFDPRFQRLSIEITAPGAEGVIIAMRRPAAYQQPGSAELRELVEAGAYADQKALVVGGSRGLGELCAKLLAAGGADVLLTYRYGAADAQAVVDDIRASGGLAAHLFYDVLSEDGDSSQALSQGWLPTHVYYFATPAIFVAAKDKFSTPIFDRFCDYYVDGFNRLYIAIRSLTSGALSFYYPSSTAVQEAVPGMGEYAAAKAAGERLCSFLAVSDSKLFIKLARLPRLPSDQTLSFVDVETDSPLSVMLDILNS